MINDRTDLIKQALSSVFDRVVDLFDGINVSEHRNETICFTGIDSYRLSEPVADGSGASSRSAEIKYAVKLLAGKNMSAGELAEKFDASAADALLSSGLTVKELKRSSCEYSKEHGRHVLTAELTVSDPCAGASAAESVGFSLDGTEFFCMRSYELKNTFKTADIPTLGNGIRTRTVGKKPLVVTLKGGIAGAGASAVYSSLASRLNGGKSSVGVNGMTFGSMVMTGLDLVGKAGGLSELTVEFTEVNED